MLIGIGHVTNNKINAEPLRANFEYRGNPLSKNLLLKRTLDGRIWLRRIQFSAEFELSLA